MTLRAVFALAVLWLLAPAAGAAGDHGVILLYHRIADDGPASTRVDPSRFEEHLDWLADHGFRVMPLGRMLDALYNGGELPGKAVAITFDDAYASVYETAFPALSARQMPFSVFVATRPLDESYSGFMSWSQVRAMHASGLVEFGAHSLSHGHLEVRQTGESRADWRQRVRREITASRQRLEDELGEPALAVFAYPFGEYSRDTLALVDDLGLRGLAQQSGAVGPGTPANRIPRFALAKGQDSLERLQTAVNARPLPVNAGQEQPFVLTPKTADPTTLVLQVDLDERSLSQLACYAASGERLDITTRETEVTVTLPALAPGRNKINCTAHAGGPDGGYYWYSRLWVKAAADGSLPD